MYLKEIHITNFRNYEDLSLSLHDGINIIYGDNGQGKTNLLESVYVLGITKSHRSFIDHHLIQQGKSQALVSGIVEDNGISTVLSVAITTAKKRLQVDQSEVKKFNDYLNYLHLIIFYPEDLSLIKGSPQERRRYLNLELSQLYNYYIVLLNDFHKLLKMRNDTLKNIANRIEPDLSYFHVLTQYYIEKAILIYRMREKFICRLNELCEPIFKDISGLSHFHLEYQTQIHPDVFSIEHLRETLKKELENKYAQEIRYGVTLIGPHKDDIIFMVDTQNLKLYGSQGQQRMAVLSLKLAEIELFRSYTNSVPVLLLDDVFSELDECKKNNLLRYIVGDIQTIITTTDLKSIDPTILRQSKKIKIQQGKIDLQEEVE